MVARHVGRRSGEESFQAGLTAVAPESGAVDAIGHRVVHGGARFREPVAIEAAVEEAIAELTPLAPRHQQAALTGIAAARELFAGVPMVAVFDTAFHAGRPPASMHYALPDEVLKRGGIARYGFHGLAHASLVRALAEATGRPTGEVGAVTLQLGAGCSACAVERGRSIETSMGYTPLGGLVMTTRSGDVDPSVVLQLVADGLSPGEARALLSERSGLLGIAGSDSVRELLRREAAGNRAAALALEVFVRRIVMTVGAYLTLLGGEGVIVFGGGIGTHSAEVRSRVAAGLAAWDVRLDDERNAAGEPGAIGAPGSREIWVFASDEERAIAESTAAIVRG